MSLDPKLTAAIKKVRAGLLVVIANIKERPDYVKRSELPAIVKLLTAFNQTLLNTGNQKTLSEHDEATLKTEAADNVQPALSELMDSNLKMSKMGQLNTSRTISPKMALSHNRNLEVEQSAISNLIAQLHGAGTPEPEPEPQPAPQPTPVPQPVPPTPQPTPPAQVVLEKLVVQGAEQTKSGTYYQFYSNDQVIRIKAVTKPDTADAWAQVSWHGGDVDFSGAANLRSVPLNQLTAPGTPLTISASVNGQSQSVNVAVVPDIRGFDVSGAVSEGDASWALESPESEPVVVKAIVEPDTSDAYKFLLWEGGEKDSQNSDDKRLVSADMLKDPSKPLPVTVKVNLD